MNVRRAWLSLFGAALWPCLCLSGALVVAPAALAQSAPPYHWQSVPFGGGGYVDGSVYHPRARDILYTRTDIGGLYRYDYPAKQWIPLLDHLSRQDGDLMGVLSIALDPANPDRVYAACGLYLGQWSRKGAILRSDDRGRTWKVTELPIHVGGNSDGRGSGERLVVDPRNPQTLYYGSNQDGLWKSSDGGQSFTRTAASARAFSLVAADPADASLLWAGTADAQGALLLSRDGGQSFAPVDGLPAMVPQRLAFASDGSLYVTFAKGDSKSPVNPNNAASGAVWKRDGANGKWRDVTPKMPANASGGFSGVDVSRDGTVAVSTLDRWYPGDDIYVSRDGGERWTGLSEKARHLPTDYPWLVNYLKGEDRMGHWISDLKFNPFNQDEMVYGTGYGLWMSRNFASAKGNETVDFDFAVRNLEETATLQLVSPTGGASVMAAMGDVGGGAWDDLTKSPSTGLFTPNNENNLSIDYAGLKPGLIVRSVANSPTHGFASRDGGASWTPLAASPYRPPAKDAPWRGPGSIAISAGGTSLVWAPEKDGAYHSADGGKSWKPSTGLPTTPDLTLRPIADKAADGIFYAFDRSASRILASGDGGARFDILVEGLPKLEPWQDASLAIVPGRIRDLWLAGPFGLFHSPDSKSKMAQIRGVNEAWQISFGAPMTKGDYPAIFLWGKVNGIDGLWRSDDRAANWVRINDDAHRFGELRKIAGDMVDPGTLYLAPHGRGVIVGMPADKPLPVAVAAVPTKVAAEPRRIAIDIKGKTEPLDRFFDISVGADYSGTMIRPANMAQLKTSVDELGFRYVRFHDIFHDKLGTVRKVDGETVYDWTQLDQLFDGLLERKIRPFVELGFTPEVMKTSDQKIFWWQGNTSQPKHDEWQALVDAFVRHLEARYGRKEVRQWYFEVWNEPNLAGFFETGDQKAYFELYALTARTIKAIDPELRVGGPATAGAAWVAELLDYAATQNVPIDFASTHTYGVNSGFLDEKGVEDTKLAPSPQAVTQDVLRVRQQIASSKFPNLPLFMTEWSTSYNPRDLVHDSYINATYLLAKLKAVEGSVQGMSYWVYSDLFEEPGPPDRAFHGGFGLMTKDGIRKPAWFTYKYLHALKDGKLTVGDPQAWVTTDGKEAAAVIWDFQQPVQPVSNRSFFGRLVPNAPSRDVALTFGGLKAGGRYRLTVNRVGYRANDAYSAYIDMGKPVELSPDQKRQLEELTRDLPETDRMVQADASGRIAETVKMNSNDIVLVKAVPAN